MITRLEARNPQGSLLSLPLDEVNNGLIVAGIEGLEPVKATLVSSNFANLDGAQYQSSRRETRIITIKFELEIDYGPQSAQALRTRLYPYFMPKSLVHLRFIRTDGLDADISGRVESFEAPLFTEAPAFNISITCFDPDFTHEVPVDFAGETTAGASEVVLNYEGTIETGFLFTLPVDRDISSFTIYHRPPDGTLRILDYENPMVAGDVLRINTEVGSKGVYLTHLNVEKSVLWAMAPQSHWLELQPGANHLRVYAEGIAIPYTIRYTNKYGGL